jgi:hypothetical protein
LLTGVLAAQYDNPLELICHQRAFDGLSWLTKRNPVSRQLITTTLKLPLLAT